MSRATGARNVPRRLASATSAVTGGDGPPPAVAVAVRQAAHFDPRLISISAGLLAAIPVVVVLGGGIAVGQTVAGVTMAAGAMLVGIAWRAGGGRPPLALMATDALLMAISTFVGSVTGAVSWLHLVALCLWSAMAGLLAAVGNRGAVLGTQAIVALVVFGRFAEPAHTALGLAALVLAGGAAQVVFLTVVRWPLPLRSQREATAAAYRELSVLATAPPDASSLPVATALDQAGATLASPTLFGDGAITTLRDLVNEGNRLRVGLSAIQSLLRQQGSADRPDQRAVHIMELSGAVLKLVALTIEGDGHAADALQERVHVISADAVALVDELETPKVDGGSALQRSRAVQTARRLSALAAQLRAVSRLAPAAGDAAGLRSRRPLRRTNRPLELLRADLSDIRANANLASPAGRHALRLAVVVPLTYLISQALPLQRSYWMVVAAAAVLRPDFSGTFTRGTERALGTCLGVAIAGAIAVAFHPGETATVVLVAVFAWTAYATFPASFAVGFGFITAMVVFLLNVIAPETVATASARLLDTLVGGAIGLAAYALWPTWSNRSARQALIELIGAERVYLEATVGALVAGRRIDNRDIRPLSRGLRLARTKADATVGRSLAEPEQHRIDAERSESGLATIRRLVQASHVLRLDAEEDHDHQPRPALARLAGEIDDELAAVQTQIENRDRPGSHRAPALPHLRASYGAFAHACREDLADTALLAQLDEIVDATNGLAALAGLDPVGDDADDTEGEVEGESDGQRPRRTVGAPNAP
jgi:Fusaric acid resistance protein-like/FUSC-like inner membrane protein yccS